MAETAEELRADLQDIVDGAPWITSIDRHGLEDYLLDRARATRLERWLAEAGDRYPEGHKRAGEIRSRDLKELGTLRRRMLDHRARLGLDPAARVRLAVDRSMTTDVAALWASMERDELVAGTDDVVDDAEGSE